MKKNRLNQINLPYMVNVNEGGIDKRIVASHNPDLFILTIALIVLITRLI